MNNASKWLIALPFSVLVALVVPAMITSDLFWFVGSWSDTLYVFLTASMWLIATAFVDVSKPRGKPDLANRLISLGLVLSVPISVADRIFLLGSILPTLVPILGLVLSLMAIILGLWARAALGKSYSPRANSNAGSQLVQSGPYQWVRHPLYASACLWALCWPLLISSLMGALITCGLVGSAVLQRIEAEEISLIRMFGEAYTKYQKTTWRLIPYIY